MPRLLAVLCSCLAFSLVAAGCGEDEEEGGGEGGGGGQAQTEDKAGSGGGGGKTAEVAMREIQFQPATVTISKGGKVTWTNEETVPHDVTKTGGPGPDFSSGESGGMAEGDTFSHSFDTPGEVEYVCTVHANMEGRVTVK